MNTEEKRKMGVPGIILLCLIAAVAVMGIFVYQQNAPTVAHTEAVDSPDPGITPADGSQRQ